MSGQVNLVSGEVHVSCPDHSYICANFRCNNILTSYEVDKLSKSRNKRARSRYDYCVGCRRYKDRIESIRCVECGGPFGFPTGRTPTAKLCSQCKKRNHDKIVNNIQLDYRDALRVARQDRDCRICGEKTGGRLDCSDKCRFKWHAQTKAKNSEEMRNEIKANRFCQECEGSIPFQSDFRNRYCSVKCKKSRNLRVIRIYRQNKKEINSGLVMV